MFPFLKRPHLLRNVAIALLIALGAWMFCRPDHTVGMGEADPRILDGMAAVLPALKAPEKTWTVRLSGSDERGEHNMRFRFSAAAPRVTHYFAKTYQGKNQLGVLEEETGLNAGPVTLIKHYRAPLPFFGDILPNTFYGKALLLELNARPSPDFPMLIGSKFEADLTYKIVYSTGDAAGFEKSKQVCSAIEQVDAKTLHKNAAGPAIRVACELITQEGTWVKTETIEYWYLADPRIWYQTSYRRIDGGNSTQKSYKLIDVAVREG